MAFAKKTWEDRITEFPNRRTINDGVVTKRVTVGRDEGTIYQEGDAFSAQNMNDLEERIEDAINDGQSLTPGENIKIENGEISVTDFMTVQEAHNLWTNA